MVIILGSDHAGFKAKHAIVQHLERKGVSFVDVGTFSEDSVDYPDYAFLVGREVAKNKGKDKGILVCGSGIGVCMAANKVKGIRAGLVFDPKVAVLASEHDDLNVLCLAGRQITVKKALAIVDAWLAAPKISEARHKRRLAKIATYEKTHLC